MKLSIEQLKLTLGDLSFEYSAQMNDGIIGIYGISGSGKSTLLKLIAGIESAQTGRLQFNETVFFDSSKGVDIPAHRRRVGVVFQEHFLFPHMTVLKNLQYGMQFTESKKIAPADVIKLLDLSELLSQKPSRLSGGERQRVAIGRALLQQPELLLLDEPFSSLDQGRRRQIISYLLGIHNRFHIPLVVVSHDLTDILKLTTSMVIIENQSILSAGQYMQIVGSGVAPDLIAPKHFVNTVELLHLQHVPQKRVNHFGITADGDPLITTNSDVFNDERQHGKRVRLSIAPDDIALSTHACANVSIQNQLPGIVTEILHMNDSFFVTIDCGVSLIAEITPSALYQLDIKPHMKIWCLFKAKAVEVVHVFADHVFADN